MSLTPGTRLGPYEITGKLGEGGMGEVYRATDTKLDRQVAIKVLPAAFTQDENRLDRFAREAKLLAQLHHPHIASIFGIEEADGTRALVMELVEGPTLAEHLDAGPLAAEEALPIARQIAAALEEAHEKGIIHRDLKPQNIKLTPDGRVKVLDFGLAKAMDPGGIGAASPMASPTMMTSPTLTAMPGTQLGVILGTAAYMAPEQARGQAVDKRADIWAFGVVLYEMLSGVKLFAAETVSDTLAGVLKTEVDVGRLPAETPGAIRRLLRRCLERNPRNRLHDVADARIVIDDLIAGTDPSEGQGGSVAAATPRSGRRRVHALWLGALVVASVGAALFSRLTTGPEAVPRPPQRFAIQLGIDQELAVGGNSLFTFSPDGQNLAFSGMVDGRRMILIRPLGEREATPVPGTDDGEAPFFSLDGAWIGFVARGQLMKIPVEGGRPVRIGEARGAGGATWLNDGSIVVAPIYSDGLFRLASEGGELERLTTPDRGDGVLGHWWPEALPGGRWMLFTAFRTPVDDSRVGVVHLDTREVRWLVDGGFFGRYSPSGHLLYAKGDRLYAVPFDAATAKATGAAKAVLGDLAVEQTGGFALLSLSPQGTLAYATDSLAHPPAELVWLDRSGRSTPALSERHHFLSVALSPDDRRAALTILGKSRDLWTLSLERGTLSRLTSGDDTEFSPTWTPDGRQLLYVVDRPPFELHRIAAGSPDTGRPLWEEPAEFDMTAPAITPDGRLLVYALTEEGTGQNLYVRPLDGSEAPRAFRAGRGEESHPTFSPSGRWLAYESDDTGRLEIYAEPFPGPGERIQLTADGGREPFWAANDELFYRRNNELLILAPLSDTALDFAPPQTLFSFPILPYANGGVPSRTYAVTSNGQRILAITIPEGSRPRQIDIITDWTTELARQVPTDRR
jgi:eukaryotic-like serine/threonine-protein kinase